MVADVATKVHPPETFASHTEPVRLWDRDLPDEPIQSFRHSGWKADRLRVWDALCCFYSKSPALDRFATCGLHPHVFRSTDPPYRYKVAGDSCRNRFCVPCARQRGNLIASNVLAKLGGQPCRFLTLTLRSRDESLRDLIDQIQRSFRLLRATDTWNRAVTGGVAFIESKWNPEPGRWHVHLHAVLQGAWVNKPELEAHWKRITKGSYVCDLQHCPDSLRVGKYIVKYCAKPYDHSVVLDAVRLHEAIGAFRGRRLFTTFGDWRGVPLLHVDPNSKWVNIGLLADVIARAKAGSTLAETILTQINAAATVVALAEHEPRPPPLESLRTPEPIPGYQHRLDLHDPRLASCPLAS